MQWSCSIVPCKILKLWKPIHDSGISESMLYLTKLRFMAQSPYYGHVELVS